jgi:hypothetical protein
MNVRIFGGRTFNSHMFPRLILLAAWMLFGLVLSAQRATAVLLQDGLLRIDLGELRLFADVPPNGKPAGLSGGDVALCPLPRVEGAFGPWLSGNALDSLSFAVGERTGAYVSVRATPYEGLTHASFVVQWNGRRLYFSGNTADPKDLLAAQDIDVAFLNPALIGALRAQGRKVYAKKVVLYHVGASAAEDLPGAPCDRCEQLVPQPGEAVTLFR